MLVHQWVFMHQWVFIHILHRFSSVAPSGAFSLSAVLLQRWDMGRRRSAQEQTQSQRKQMSKCLYGEGRCYHLEQTWEPKFATCLEDRQLPSGFTHWSVSDVAAEEVLRQVVVQKVTSVPKHRSDLAASSLLLAVSERLLPLQDHVVEFLQAGLQALTIQRRAALCVAQRGRAQLMESQNLLHLKHRRHKTRTSVTTRGPIHWIFPLIGGTIWRPSVILTD